MFEIEGVELFANSVQGHGSFVPIDFSILGVPLPLLLALLRADDALFSKRSL